MKFLHLADLHLGRILNGFSLLEDQEYLLRQILGIVEQRKPDAVLIAGDIYDRPIPSPESVTLFDWFLNELRARNALVLFIAGNHDNARRLAYGEALMEKAGVYMSKLFDGTIKRVRLNDEYGPVDFYLLPYLRSPHVRALYPDEKIEDYTDAIRVVLSHSEYEEGVRKVILSHQSVATDEKRLEDEVGGIKKVSSTLFDPFDYAALGHTHKPGPIGRKAVRYAGTPMKYAFKNLDLASSACYVTLGPVGTEAEIELINLKPLHELREMRGSFEEIMNPSFCPDDQKQDLYRVILSDEEDVYEGMRKLRTLYPNVLELDYDNTRTRSNKVAFKSGKVEMTKSKIDLFAEFYEKQNGASLSEEQRDYCLDLMKTIWGDEQ